MLVRLFSGSTGNSRGLERTFQSLLEPLSTGPLELGLGPIHAKQKHHFNKMKTATPAVGRLVLCPLGSQGSRFQSPRSSGRTELRCFSGWHLPMTDVNSSGAELPAAMNVAPATSSLRCRRCRGAKAQVSLLLEERLSLLQVPAQSLLSFPSSPAGPHLLSGQYQGGGYMLPPSKGSDKIQGSQARCLGGCRDNGGRGVVL